MVTSGDESLGDIPPASDSSSESRPSDLQDFIDDGDQAGLQDSEDPPKYDETPGEAGMCTTVGRDSDMYTCTHVHV